MTRSNYEERQAARKERLLECADKADQRAEDAERAVDEIAGAIPMGQPILVGHHSERRHRRDLETPAVPTASALRRRSSAYFRSSMVFRMPRSIRSSDDPDAVTKLQAKHDELERKQERMRAMNAAWRKAGKPDPTEAERWKAVGDAVGLTPDELGRVRLQLAERASYEEARFCSVR